MKSDETIDEVLNVIKKKFKEKFNKDINVDALLKVADSQFSILPESFEHKKEIKLDGFARFGILEGQENAVVNRIRFEKFDNLSQEEKDRIIAYQKKVLITKKNNDPQENRVGTFRRLGDIKEEGKEDESIH